MKDCKMNSLFHYKIPKKNKYVDYTNNDSKIPQPIILNLRV